MTDVTPLILGLAAPVSTLLGVWLGTHLQADKQGRLARESRLFDHKIEAYFELMDRASVFETNLWDWKTGQLRSSMPARDSIVPVAEAVERVRLLGSVEVAVAGRKVTRAFNEVTKAEAGDVRERIDLMKSAIVDLLNAVRGDLGTGGPLPRTYV